jgi:hypothetical protein
MKDIQKYFGSTNSGTAYLFLYTAFDFDHSDILSSIMPKGWVPPTNVKDYSTTPTSFDPSGLYDKEQFSAPPTNLSALSSPEESRNSIEKENSPANSYITAPPAGTGGRKGSRGWGWLSGKPTKKKPQ